MIGATLVRGHAGSFRPRSLGWRVCTRCGIDWQIRGSVEKAGTECVSCRSFRKYEEALAAGCKYPERGATFAAKTCCECSRCVATREKRAEHMRRSRAKGASSDVR